MKITERKLRKFIKDIIREIEFKDEESFKKYKSKHKMRSSTKVKIGGKETTVGDASSGDVSVKVQQKPKEKKKMNKSEQKKHAINFMDKLDIYPYRMRSMVLIADESPADSFKFHQSRLGDLFSGVTSNLVDTLVTTTKELSNSKINSELKNRAKALHNDITSAKNKYHGRVIGVHNKLWPGIRDTGTKKEIKNFHKKMEKLEKSASKLYAKKLIPVSKDIEKLMNDFIDTYDIPRNDDIMRKAADARYKEIEKAKKAKNKKTSKVKPKNKAEKSLVKDLSSEYKETEEHAGESAAMDVIDDGIHDYMTDTLKIEEDDPKWDKTFDKLTELVWDKIEK